MTLRANDMPGFREPASLQLLRYTFFPEQFLLQGRQRYGTPFQARFAGYGSFAFLTDPEAIHQVFSGDPDVFHSGESNAFLAETLGPSSLLVLDGDRHAVQRKPQVPAFQGRRMRAHAEQMIEATRLQVESWRGRRILLETECREITLQIILRAVFGWREGAGLRAFASKARIYMDKVGSPMVLLAPLIPRPLWNLGGWPAILRAQRSIDADLLAWIDEWRSSPPEDAEDVFASLLRATHDNGSVFRNDELRDHLFTLLLAGHDTTGVALAWTFSEILRHPEVLGEIQSELDQVFPDHEVSPEGLEQLPYLDAAIREALRLRPVVPFVPRLVKQTVTIGDHVFEPGNQVEPCILLVHRDPDLYPDPLAFRPERFLDHTPGSNTWFPFGGGTRRCLGMWFALFEMKVVLATILGQRNFERSSSRVPSIRRRGLLLAPRGGVPAVPVPHH